MKPNQTSNFLPMSAFPMNSPGNYLSITTSGYLHLPKGFLEQHNFGRFRYIDLFWDPDQQRLAIVPLREKSRARVWKLSRYALGGAHITIRRFCKHCQIDIARVAGRYQWEKITIPGQGRAFAIRLDEQQRRPLRGATLEAKSL